MPTPEEILARPAVYDDRYELLYSVPVTDFSLKASLYKHIRSSAHVAIIEAPDDNKACTIGFRTPVKNSKGIPHIVEHSVLNGSKKFPVKEPFAELLKGSLYSSLNAYTYPDRTIYLFSSPNHKDFQSLMDVYLDAVFHPRVITNNMGFLQEGWHYDLTDKQHPLTVKGVVYNEMKGSLSSPESLLYHKIQENLFPNNTYHYNSGGDPPDIRTLLYEEFQEFYEQLYDATNGLVVIYGDVDPKEQLQFLDGHLSCVEPRNKKTEVSIEFQKKLEQPYNVTKPYPYSDNPEEAGRKDIVAVSWLLHDTELSTKERLCLDIVSHLLMGTSACFLRKALTDSQLGTAVIGGGLESSLLQLVFSVGLKGMKKGSESQENLEKVVMETLNKVVSEGIPESAIDAAVNTVEFRLRECNFGSYPKGLVFALEIVQEWNYGRDILSALRFEDDLKSIKEDLKAKKPIFEELIKKYLLNNKHRLTLSVTPDMNMQKEEQEKEEKELANIKSSMTQDEISNIIDTTEKLVQEQKREETAEELSVIPSLKLSDVPPTIQTLPTNINKNNACTVLETTLPSQNILYMTASFNLTEHLKREINTVEGIIASHLADMDLVFLLPVFSRLSLETGTSKLDRVEFSRVIEAKTGGVKMISQAGVKSSDEVLSPKDCDVYLYLKGKCVGDKVPDLMQLMLDILSDAKLINQQRTIEVLKEKLAGLESAILHSGDSFARLRVKAQHTVFGVLNDLTSGLSAIRKTKQLLNDAQNNWPSVSTKLQTIKNILLNLDVSKDMVIGLTSDEDLIHDTRQHVARFISEFSKLKKDTDNKTSHNKEWNVPINEKTNEALIVPSTVNYVALGGRVYEPGERIPGGAKVARHYTELPLLWDAIRVVGGAYGAFFQVDRSTGVFTFCSYRDPNLVESIEAYKTCAKKLQSLELDNAELTKAILGVVRGLDAPKTTEQKNWIALQRYLDGVSDEQRQTIRTEVLSTTVAQLREFGDRLYKSVDKGVVAVTAGADAVAKADKSLTGDEKGFFKCTNVFGSDPSPKM